MEHKLCIKCRKAKPATNLFFPKCGTTRDHLNTTCKDCMARQSREYRQQKKRANQGKNPHDGTEKTCGGCGRAKSRHPSDFGRDGTQPDGLSAACRECRKGRTANYRERRPLYNTWATIITRCYNPKCQKYSYYGGRGITVCDEWRQSFEAFESWATAAGWRKGLEIDRRDNDGPYSPDNCRVTTHTGNVRNRSSTVLTADIAREIKRIRREEGIGPRLIARRLGVPESAAGQVVYGKSWVEV